MMVVQHTRTRCSKITIISQLVVIPLRGMKFIRHSHTQIASGSQKLKTISCGSFAFYPASFAVETSLKLVIMNIVWLPVHLAWLYAGVKINSLDLPPRIQRAINLGMAACLLAVVILSVWSVADQPAGIAG